MVHIAYYTELNLQICNYAQKRRICRKNSTHAKLKTTFAAIFALVERLPTSATLLNNRNCSAAKISKVCSSNNDADQGKGVPDDKRMRKLI